ncbi:phosphonate metabolism protein/1,5-bisphosphokinase (PRPP-forming) PhnN [Salinarimonas ramus]|uniref:Ribose 1,5-bisphosphate phosphokinase PhnN n=1 Tax=Salinarimonas ramus TaxID=690164 RepID=A0A917Q6L2_9HYPH|nr:phosphonate metabolism protein/1,5-bisphosphokinase (PRPP-forming) PhnN [Salinarimonas ramus]GGK30134.1 ribose 1,5-bisphosphate phosphokinase PhnN [Salinarimonas ramus]
MSGAADRSGPGALVLVVGPSGVGKDTLIDGARAALAGDERIRFPHRLVTRPVSAHEAHDTISQADFDEGVATGRFALWWRAHGLGYAIPRKVTQAVEDGAVCVVNGSRSRVEAARAALPGVVVVEVTAPREVLAARIAARGRDEDAQARLARSDGLAPIEADVTIVNDRSPEEGIAALVAALRGIGTRGVAGALEEVGARQ